MSDPRVISTAAELEKFQAKFNEAVSEDTSILDEADAVEKARFQTRMARAMDELRAAEKRPGVMSSPPNQLGALMQSLLTERATETRDLGNGQTLEAKFDTRDWRWAGTLWHMLKDAQNKFTWQKAPAGAEKVAQFGNTVCLAVFSDWATGLYGASVIARSIADPQRKVDIVLHLGDVYYSGTTGEFQDRFSKLWPARPAALNRTLNGNHEMYSGGRPYFDTISKAPFEQKASYFAYQNDHWIIVGLDTAYEDHDLTQDQVTWLTNIVAGAERRKIVLFSHHQPFSMLSGQGPNLQQKLRDLLEKRKIFAWYWGHEHECVIYDRHDGWQLYGRCVGHAGMPEFRPAALGAPVPTRRLSRLEKTADSPGALVLDGPNPYIKGEETSFTPHGFVSLEFDDDRLLERYLDPDGTEFHRNELK
jgi:hypothetical protein